MYEFNWEGKELAYKLAQTPSTGTLIPDKESSKNWDDTENLYIEGDNLEVLKLLQKSYFGKVKMIYIDPPYNTGNDFVYHDDFKDNIANYKEITNQTTKANPETNGRYHTDWLNMMYPRLKLARNLLTDDGVIFLSIDDNEVHNLKKVCDEIFGAENFVAEFTWIKKKKGSHLSKTVRNMTEYVLAYSKEITKIELFGEEAYTDKWQPLAKRTNAHKTLTFKANTLETKLKDGQYKNGLYGEGTSAIRFKNDFYVKDGKIVSELDVEGSFVWIQKKLDDELELGTRVALSTKFGFNALRSNQADKIKRPTTILDSKLNIGTNEDAYGEAISLFEKENIMSYPKPVSLIKYLINTLGYYDKNFIVLDFFSGSATTSHATVQLNLEYNSNIKFIMVQLPELTDEKSEAYKSGYKNICEIGKERIRRAGDKIVSENKDKEGIENLDIGFKVFKLVYNNLNNKGEVDKMYNEKLIELLKIEILTNKKPKELKGKKKIATINKDADYKVQVFIDDDFNLYYQDNHAFASCESKIVDNKVETTWNSCKCWFKIIGLYECRNNHIVDILRDLNSYSEYLYPKNNVADNVMLSRLYEQMVNVYLDYVND